MNAALADIHRNPLKIMIVGAGTGGLCLAQGLHSRGMEVQVFERDRSPTDRLQGYRLSINPVGNKALKTCLPPPCYEEFVRNTASPSTNVTFLDHRMHRLLGLELADARNPEERELPVSRTALRDVLSRGLGSIVHFGRKFTGFEHSADGRVVARFEDGSSESGDLLIGADGASSRVRGQLLPHAQRVETGIVAVTGKFALSEVDAGAIPTPVMKGPTLIMGPKGGFLFANAVTYGHRRRGCTDVEVDESDYVMWGFSAHRELIGLPGRPELASGAAAKNAVLRFMREWDPALRRLIEWAQVSTMTAFSIKTSVPVAPWRTVNVTLLGDALHNMTPFRGIGANTALRDAEALLRALLGVSRGESTLIPALARYERDMVDYGFAAVQSSLKDMERFHTTGPLARAATRMLFRTVDHIAPLRSIFLGR